MGARINVLFLIALFAPCLQPVDAPNLSNRGCYVETSDGETPCGVKVPVGNYVYLDSSSSGDSSGRLTEDESEDIAGSQSEGSLSIENSLIRGSSAWCSIDHVDGFRGVCGSYDQLNDSDEPDGCSIVIPDGKKCAFDAMRSNDICDGDKVRIRECPATGPGFGKQYSQYLEVCSFYDQN